MSTLLRAIVCLRMLRRYRETATDHIYQGICCRLYLHSLRTSTDTQIPMQTRHSNKVLRRGPPPIGTDQHRQSITEEQGQHTASPCDHITNTRLQNMPRHLQEHPQITPMEQVYGLIPRRIERRVCSRSATPLQCRSQLRCPTILICSLHYLNQLLAGRALAIYIPSTLDLPYRWLPRTSISQDRPTIESWSRSFLH